MRATLGVEPRPPMQPPEELPASPRFTAHAVSCFERAGKKIFRGATAASAVSEADAREQARQVAHRRCELAADGQPVRHMLDRYPYPERTVVEPVVQRLAAADDAGRELARLTRNAYGATVLNAYNVMFVDVDTTDDTSNTVAEVIVEKRQAVEALGRVCAARSDLHFRVYATKAGLRYLCTSRLFDPTAAETQELMELLLSDKRYRVLCRVQKCFRARLTPKPWRCEASAAAAPSGVMGALRALFQARTPGLAAAPASEFVACRFMEEVGRPPVRHPDAQAVFKLHDSLSGAFSNKPLA